MGAITDLDSLVDFMLQELWSRTKGCLEKLRAAIKTVVATDFVSAVDELDAGIRLLNSHNMSTLTRTIAEARTEIQNVVSAVAAWFDVKDLQTFPDYELGVAVEAAVETIQRNHDQQFVPKISIDVHRRLRGATLPQVLDICHILFENIVRHGGKASPDAAISFACRGNRLILEARNSIAPALNESDVAHKLATLNLNAATSFEGTKTEGGSGYRKLTKILRHDLGSTDCNLSATVHDRVFAVVVDLSLAALEAQARIPETAA
jgi:hypothetical protein